MQLKKGDYLETAGLTNDQYHAIGLKFIEAGCNPVTSDFMCLDYKEYIYIVRDEYNSFKHTDEKPEGRLLTPSQILGDDNGWYERGELPPVGTECEWSANGVSYDPCEILMYHENCVVLCHNKYRSTVRLLKVVGLTFRPIKSERERVIESAAEIIRNEQGARAINSRDCPHKASAVALANAGLLRLPESDR